MSEATVGSPRAGQGWGCRTLMKTNSKDSIMSGFSCSVSYDGEKYSASSSSPSEMIGAYYSRKHSNSDDSDEGGGDGGDGDGGDGDGPTRSIENCCLAVLRRHGRLPVFVIADTLRDQHSWSLTDDGVATLCSDLLEMGKVEFEFAHVEPVEAGTCPCLDDEVGDKENE